MLTIVPSTFSNVEVTRQATERFPVRPQDRLLRPRGRRPEPAVLVVRSRPPRSRNEQAGSHALEVHRMRFSPDVETYVRSLIHDESSDAHRRSISRTHTELTGSKPVPGM